MGGDLAPEEFQSLSRIFPVIEESLTSNLFEFSDQNYGQLHSLNSRIKGTSPQKINEYLKLIILSGF